MSLLNDALKKKQREEQVPVGFPGGGSRPAAPSRARLYTLLGIAGIVAAGIAFMLINSSDSEPPVRRIRQVDTSPATRAPAVTAAAPPPVVATAPVAAAQPAIRTVAKPAPPKVLPAPVAVVAPPAVADSAPLTPPAAAPSPSTPGETLAPVATAAPPSPPSAQPELTGALDPTLQPYYEKAQSYQKQKRYSEAATLYRQILQQSAKHQGSRLNLTTCLLESGRYREAYDLALPLSRELPDDAIVWLNLAIAEIGINENQQALLHLREAELRHGPRFEIYLNRGVAASHLGQWDQAFAAYRDAAAVSPGDASLLFNLGLASDKTGKPAEAARYYENFLQNVATTHPKRQQVNERLQTIKRYLAAQPSSTRP